MTGLQLTALAAGILLKQPRSTHNLYPGKCIKSSTHAMNTINTSMLTRHYLILSRGPVECVTVKNRCGPSTVRQTGRGAIFSMARRTYSKQMEFNRTNPVSLECVSTKYHSYRSQVTPYIYSTHASVSSISPMWGQISHIGFLLSSEVPTFPLLTRL